MVQKPVVLMVYVLLVLTVSVFAFNARPVRAMGIIYIGKSGGISPPTAPIVTFDNITYTLQDNINATDVFGIFLMRNNTIIDGNGHTLQGTGVESSGIVSSYYLTNVTIRNMNIRNFRRGIQLTFSSYINVSGNNIIGNDWYGIDMFGCHNVTINGNNLDHNGLGNDFGSAILADGYNNTIMGNTIASARYGIYCYLANCTISENIIKNNEAGIYLDHSSHNYSISNNNIISNRCGIFLDYEILHENFGNKIYHNNFVNNAQHVFILGEGTDFWDDGYPSGGNYWSNYNGTDSYSGPYQNLTGSDGIIDSPYVIDSNNTDRYPLVPPPPFPGDVNGDGVVDIYDIVLVVACYGSKSGDSSWNSRADQAKPYGIIDMLDLVTIASQYGKPYS